MTRVGLEMRSRALSSCGSRLRSTPSPAAASAATMPVRKGAWVPSDAYIQPVATGPTVRARPPQACARPSTAPCCDGAATCEARLEISGCRKPIPAPTSDTEAIIGRACCDSASPTIPDARMHAPMMSSRNSPPLRASGPMSPPWMTSPSPPTSANV